VIGWDGQVRLMGFGFCKIMGRTPDTVAGVVKGAPGIMAPEQARGERATPKSDVYQLGLLLWSLFTAKRPPEQGVRPAKMSILRTDLSRDLVDAIDNALEPLPEKRTVTCADLERLMGEVGTAEQGREELRDKAVMLRGQRAAPSETEQRMPAVGRGPAPPARASTPRRRVPVQAVRPGKPPASSQKRLSVPPASKPPGRMSERPSAGSSDEPPKSVYPLLRALAERVPKPPLLPNDRDDESPPARRAEELARPTPAEPPEPRPVRHSIAVPIGLEDSAHEWKESVPDEDSIDRMFEEALSMGPDELVARAEKIDKSAAERRARRGPTPTPPPPVPGGKVAGKSGPPAPVLRPMLTPPPPPLAQPKVPSFGGRGETPAVPEAPARRPEFAETVPAHSPLAPPPPPAATPNPPSFGLPAPMLGAPAPMAPPIRFGPPPIPPPATAPSFGAAPLATPLHPMAPPVAQAQTQDSWHANPAAPRPARRPSTLALTLAGVATGLAVAAVVLLVQRGGGGGEGSTRESTPASSAVASTAPTTQPAAAASGTPAASQAEDPVVPVDLPPGFGFLTVDFPTPGNVYISGKKLGPTGQRLQVQCGRWFVRVANQGDGRFPEWVSPGETVVVPCQDATRIEMKPGAGPVQPKSDKSKPAETTKKKKSRLFGD
jgi:serine/threonine protein kinase